MSQKENLTATLYAVNDLRLEEKPIPEPGKDEVRIKMDTVGICGSDVHYLNEGRIGNFVLEKPMVIGHEGAGTIDKCGKNVRQLQVGDRVAIEPGVPCRMCKWCKGGSYNLCPDIIFCATPPYDGNLRRFYCHAADFCHKLPDNMSLEEGALIEPTAVGVHACKRAGVGLGKTVLICGAGPIGLVSVAVAQAMGASEIVATDMESNRLQMAKVLGATGVYNVKKNVDAQQQAKDITQLFKRCEQPQITIDCCGAEASLQTGCLATRPGGCMVIVGHGPEEVKLPITYAAVREVDIRGVFRYANDYPIAIAMVSSGKVDLKPLVTHRFKLEETIDAFDASKTGAGRTIKVLIKCNMEDNSS